MKTKKEKIQECLFNIKQISDSILISKIEENKVNIPKRSFLFDDIISYCYIKLCSFQDELALLNSLAKCDDDLMKTFYIIAPAVKHIKNYKGIRQARNLIFAHYNRDRNGEFKPYWEELSKFKIPRTEIEFLNVMNCIQLINSILYTKYHILFDEYIEKVGNAMDRCIDSEIELSNDNKEINVELTNEIQKRMIENDIEKLIIDPRIYKMLYPKK